MTDDEMRKLFVNTSIAFLNSEVKKLKENPDNEIAWLLPDEYKLKEIK